MIVWPAKDPAEVLDYTWSPPLDSGDTIVSYTVATSDVTIDSDSNTPTTVTMWISGGTSGENATITLTAVTAGGRTLREVGVLPVFDRASAILALFRVRHGKFAAVADGTVGYWLAEGSAKVSAWAAADQDEGAMLLAAHNLASQGLGSGAIPAGVTSFKSGTFSATVSDGLASKTGFAATSYGRDYLALAKRNFGGPRLAWAPPTSLDA